MPGPAPHSPGTPDPQGGPEGGANSDPIICRQRLLNRMGCWLENGVEGGVVREPLAACYPKPAPRSGPAPQGGPHQPPNCSSQKPGIFPDSSSFTSRKTCRF